MGLNIWKGENTIIHEGEKILHDIKRVDEIMMAEEGHVIEICFGLSIIYLSRIFELFHVNVNVKFTLSQISNLTLQTLTFTRLKFW